MDPTASPPISQSMDHNSSARFSAASADIDSSSYADAPDLPSTSIPSPPRKFDSQCANAYYLAFDGDTLSSSNETAWKNPTAMVLVQDFNCALQENFLLQGHMYLFDRYICFYSNLFGFETKKIIPFHEVTFIRRAKVAAIFPTAIEITAGGQKYFFTSFLSRDEAFKLINDGWLQHSNGSKEITDQQDSKSENGSQENMSAIVEKSESCSQSVDNLDIIERDKNVPMTEDSKLSVNGEPETVSTSSGVQTNEVEDVEVAQSIECSSSGKSSVWEQEDSDAPGVPECYTMVAESKFPIDVEEFFHLFVSDDSVSFQESFHEKCGDKDFKCTSWRPHEIYGHTRDASFQHPIKLYFGARFGSCQEVQKYRVYKNCHLVAETSQEISDVPYGDYFRVEGRWDVERDGSDSKPGCILKVYIHVAFSKKTMWRGKIVQSTLEECREAYAIWIDLAHELLKKKNLEKEEAVSLPSNLIPNGQIILKEHGSTEKCVSERASDANISKRLPNLNDVNQKITNAQQINHSGSASVGSSLKDSFAKFCTSLKCQSTPSLILVITVAVILLLMQISILVLLSRPQRIHLIPQADGMSGMHRGGDRAETLGLLDRQMKILKEEMHVVEALLEKMQHEHTLLKRKLKDLEISRNRQ
ncbi:protein VASCULAR ASSOCIATED DEATH 1, chloroplastic [Olea europaea var. sylvestris]|uniref:protein VASCULAR ASSOCIATED DEATH 1, chloroplastic n=1 Tax=Olea europaea var. sylvestris TaxID=158386 RepID=UPI000C1D315A|nr:protein VASCULAR ASSOCIATED DEATH 1, chloroplastic [Olea europaea var. sylvestris]